MIMDCHCVYRDLTWHRWVFLAIGTMIFAVIMTLASRRSR